KRRTADEAIPTFDSDRRAAAFFGRRVRCAAADAAIDLRHGADRPCVPVTGLSLPPDQSRLTDICGISVEDHLGHYVRDCVPALADAVEGIVQSIVRTGDPVTGIEVAGQRADQADERFWVTYWHPHRNGAGEIVGVNVAAEESTERKRAEAALQASERQFHTLADSIPQLVWMADAQGAIYWLNNHWYEYTGRPAGEISARDWQSVLGHRWIDALQTGTALEAELSLLG